MTALDCSWVFIVEAASRKVMGLLYAESFPRVPVVLSSLAAYMHPPTSIPSPGCPASLSEDRKEEGGTEIEGNAGP